MKSELNYLFWFWLVNLSLALVKIGFTLRPEINLFTEEAQYWLWSQNLSWHYYSKPPLIAVFNWISTSLLGVNELGVRINAIFLGMGTSWVVYKFAEYQYQSRKIAFWAGILVMSMPLWMLFSTFHLTDSELTFFWIASLYLVYRGIREGSRGFWVLAGIAAGLGLLAKSIMIVIGPFILIYLVVTRQLGAHWKSYLIFLGIGTLGFLPGLIWNWQNEFMTFRHLAFLGGVAGTVPQFDVLVWISRFLEFMGSQIGMFSLFLFPLFLFSLFSFLKNPDRNDAFFILPAVLSWVGFAMITLFGKVEANWPAFAYTTLPIFFSKWLTDQSRTWVKARNWSVILGFGLPLLLIFPDVSPVKRYQTVIFAEKLTFKRLVGYRQISDRINFVRDSLGVKDALVISESYHMASELAFYLPEHPKTYAIKMGSRRNQFDLWEGLEKQLDKGKDGIFVSWTKESPEGVLTFDSLIYEEKFPVRFKGDSLRCAKIQVWKNLRAYHPVIAESY